MTASTKVQWRVQTKSAQGKWINGGLFETRNTARQSCARLRRTLGFGNTRVVRFDKASKS